MNRKWLWYFLGGGRGWRGEMENCAYLRKNPGYAPGWVNYNTVAFFNCGLLLQQMEGNPIFKGHIYLYLWSDITKIQKKEKWKKSKEGTWRHILQRLSLKLKTELNIKNIIIEGTENTAEEFLLLMVWILFGIWDWFYFQDLGRVELLHLIWICNALAEE